MLYSKEDADPTKAVAHGRPAPKDWSEREAGAQFAHRDLLPRLVGRIKEAASHSRRGHFRPPWRGQERVVEGVLAFEKTGGQLGHLDPVIAALVDEAHGHGASWAT